MFKNYSAGFIVKIIFHVVEDFNSFLKLKILLSSGWLFLHSRILSFIIQEILLSTLRNVKIITFIVK